MAKITLKEFCEHYRITHKTGIRWAEKGIIPAFKIGNEWRLDTNDIKRWEEARRNRPLTPEELAITLAAPDGRVTEKADGSLEVNVGWEGK